MKSRKKLAPEQYIADCTTEHKGFYDYTDTVYINSRTKVKIGCPIHGPFWQKAEAHKAGRGCPDCGELLKNKNAKGPRSRESFIEEAILAKADKPVKYDYTDVVYVDSRTHVKIICPIHGSFMQSPACHLGGQGCPKCANENRNNYKKLSTETVIERCLAARNGECTYPNTIYIGDKRKMEINCTTHGPFWQQAGNHISGQGCPKCKKCGYNQSKSGYLYILTCDEVTKVGITNKTPNHRVKQIAASGGPKFDVLSHYFFSDGSIPAALELKTHKWLATQYSRVPNKFDGSTECFLSVDLAALLNFVTPLANPEAA